MASQVNSSFHFSSWLLALPTTVPLTQATQMASFVIYGKADSSDYIAVRGGLDVWRVGQMVTQTRICFAKIIRMTLRQFDANE